MKEPLQKISYSGGYYHLYNRGNRKQNIFLESADYIRYLERLRKYKETFKIAVVCYCLMPNHFHLLVRQDSDIPIYKFILSLHTSYSMYFNKKYDKVGHLFQGRFKQVEIKTDARLLHLSSYIHLNPIVDKITHDLEKYQWSSYLDYIGLRQGTLCDKTPVLMNESADDYKRITEQEVKEQLEEKEFYEELLLKECL